MGCVAQGLDFTKRHDTLLVCSIDGRFTGMKYYPSWCYISFVKNLHPITDYQIINIRHIILAAILVNMGSFFSISIFCLDLQISHISAPSIHCLEVLKSESNAMMPLYAVVGRKSMMRVSDPKSAYRHAIYHRLFFGLLLLLPSATVPCIFLVCFPLS
ncbi:hypothetical protein ACMFMG_005877 [Clarireedia jacksonii]